MFRKRFISFVLVGILMGMVFLTGCGSNDNKGNDDTANKETKELTMWTWKVAYIPGFENVAKEYEEKTGIKVNIESFTPDDTYRQKLLAAANGGTLPDVVHIWASAGQGVENALVDLAPKVDSFENEFKSNAFDIITVKEEQVNGWQNDKNASEVLKSLKAGETYGIPLDMGGFFTFYGNKEIMEKAGLEVKAPETWEEFISIMETIKEKTGVAPLAYSGKIPDIWYSFAGCALEVMLNGEEGYQGLLTRTEKFSDPQHLKVLQAFEQLVEKDLLLPGVLTMDIDTADQQFAAGKAAFDLGGSFTMSTLLAMGMNEEDIFTFTVPAIEGSKYPEWTMNPFTLTMLSVSNQSDKQEEALDFIKFMSSKEGAILFANNGFSIPATDLGSDIEKLDPALRNIAESFTDEPAPLSRVPAYPDNFWNHAEWRVHDTMIQKIVAGEATAEEAAKAIDDAAAAEEAAGNK
ncbi:hypothetical protein SH1V18_01730 [Vallitalea longa]|uniref:Uncharacterized protein n=1 Tax=Vallitalea longa TaxID=2936439 RepID=A0A9W6DDU9_9FIRM|nr:extracellular solute-binding protein [Vallitalea longa]GKX27693.1 hypothetical protein SH1V18_01730 [Vallitalea longa]